MLLIKILYAGRMPGKDEVIDMKKIFEVKKFEERLAALKLYSADIMDEFKTNVENSPLMKERIMTIPRGNTVKLGWLPGVSGIRHFGETSLAVSLKADSCQYPPLLETNMLGGVERFNSDHIRLDCLKAIDTLNKECGADGLKQIYWNLTSKFVEELLDEYTQELAKPNMKNFRDSLKLDEPREIGYKLYATKTTHGIELNIKGEEPFLVVWELAPSEDTFDGVIIDADKLSISAFETLVRLVKFMKCVHFIKEGNSRLGELRVYASALEKRAKFVEMSLEGSNWAYNPVFFNGKEIDGKISFKWRIDAFGKRFCTLKDLFDSGLLGVELGPSKFDRDTVSILALLKDEFLYSRPIQGTRLALGKEANEMSGTEFMENHILGGIYRELLQAIESGNGAQIGYVYTTAKTISVCR